MVALLGCVVLGEIEGDSDEAIPWSRMDWLSCSALNECQD